MALLPFYIPGKRRINVIIVGGGYAGMTVLTTLKQYASNVDITLIDPNTHHLKITHLHETFRYPLSDLRVPFSELEKRFGCRHIQASLAINGAMLQQWQLDKYLAVGNEILHFDYLVIATGGEMPEPEPVANVLTLQDFMHTAGSSLLLNHLKTVAVEEPVISVVGAGATGIQFLFEIRQFLCRQKISARLRLINAGDHVLTQFPCGFNSYVQSRMQEFKIDCMPNTQYHGQTNQKILFEDKQSGKADTLPSHLTLLFLGKKQEHIWPANTFGQITIDQKILPHIFTAGDCSIYNALGSNVQSAQSAVRKGKLIARNILRHSGLLKILEPYLHHDIGYVVNLGPTDAVGWLVTQGNIVTGLPALAIKEIVETQYDLLLMGIDTYVI
ncbi:MAG: FAD-dependent oxidoreductase [Nitrosomonas sp.]|nr:FAD-dependent oxidoreductase [Nitrosomonas sp.]